MKLQTYIGVTIRIILIGIIGMMFTFIPEHLHGFFGDTPKDGLYSTEIDKEWSWGARHYWYMFMTTLLFLFNVANFITYLVKRINADFKLQSKA